MRTSLITTGNLIALYNGYLRNDTATDFLNYLASNNYLVAVNGNSLQFENAEFPPATTDLNYQIDNPTHREKLGELFDFIAEHDESVKDLIGTTTKEEVLQDVEANAFVNSYKLNTYYHEKLFEKYKLGDKNPKLDKMKRKTTWIAKKFVIPTLITAAITTAVGATIALIPALAGTSIFWSGNALVGIRSLGQLGLLSGLIGTPTFILGKDLINWLVYKRYSNENQLETLKKSDVKNVNDINSLNLGIVNLIKNFKEDQEIIDECRKSKNPFKRLNGYIHRKWNRNKLHSLTAFTRDFLKVYNSTVDANDRAKYAAYLEYIENFCNEVYTKDEQQALRNKKRGKTSKRLYADIFVRELIPYLDNEGQSRRKSKAKSIKRAVTARRELAKATLGDETARPIKLIEKQPSGNEPVRRNRTINIPTHTPTPTPDPTKSITTKKPLSKPGKKLLEALGITPDKFEDPNAPIPTSDPAKPAKPEQKRLPEPKRKLLPSRGIIYLPDKLPQDTTVDYTMSGNGGYNVVMPNATTKNQISDSTKQKTTTKTKKQADNSTKQKSTNQPKNQTTDSTKQKTTTKTKKQADNSTKQKSTNQPKNQTTDSTKQPAKTQTTTQAPVKRTQSTTTKQTVKPTKPLTENKTDSVKSADNSSIDKTKSEGTTESKNTKKPINLYDYVGREPAKTEQIKSSEEKANNPKPAQSTEEKKQVVSSSTTPTTDPSSKLVDQATKKNTEKSKDTSSIDLSKISEEALKFTEEMILKNVHNIPNLTKVDRQVIKTIQEKQRNGQVAGRSFRKDKNDENKDSYLKLFTITSELIKRVYTYSDDALNK